MHTISDWNKMRTMQSTQNLKRVCPQCNKEFSIKMPWQKFDTEKCRIQFHLNIRQESIKLFKEKIFN